MANGSSGNKGIIEMITISDDDEEEKAPKQTSSALSSSSEPEKNHAGVVKTDEADGESSVLSEDDRDKHIFERFISECSKYLQFPVDNRIIEKLRKYYGLSTQSYIQSSKFHTLLDHNVRKIGERNSDVYLCIQEVLHELETNRSDSSKKVRKLERWLAKADKKIKELQEREVDWDDDDQSAYMEEAQMKARFTKVYQKIMELKGCPKTRSQLVGKKYKYEGTRYPEINRNITKFIKKMNTFPDYTEIAHIIRETNNKGGRFLSEEGILQLAREAFVEVGEDLKQMRLRQFHFTIGCHLTDSIDEASDPAGIDEELRKKLEENKVLAKQRIDDVVEKYAAEQVRLKLEPKEEGDGIDEGSSGEEDSDEAENVQNDQFNANEVLAEDSEDSSDVPGCSATNQKRKNGEAPAQKTIARPASAASQSTSVAQVPIPKKPRIELAKADEDDIIVLD